MTPTRDEIRRELERLVGSSVLSPQERRLLETIVFHSTDGDPSRLYQKALAADADINNVRQIGVVATRIRGKLRAHYDGVTPSPTLQILLSDRGYEANFVYRHAQRPLGDAAMLAIANARAALDQRTLPGVAAALKYVEQAHAADHDHPLPLSVKAQCHSTRALYGVDARTDLLEAEAIVNRIGPGADRPWEYWFARASVRMTLHWDWDGAEADFAQAITLSNGDARFNAWHTALLAARRRTTEAVEHLRVAVSRTPDSPIVRADLAINQIYANQLEEAEHTIRTALALFGRRAHYLLYVHLAILHEARGDNARAVDAIHRVPLAWPKTAITLGLRALFTGLNGQRGIARWHLSKLRGAKLLANRQVPAIQLAVASLGTGDADAAVHWLRVASIYERDPNAILNGVYPFFRHLYRHAGFRELIIDQMKLPLPD